MLLRHDFFGFEVASLILLISVFLAYSVLSTCIPTMSGFGSIGTSVSFIMCSLFPYYEYLVAVRS